MTKYDAARPGAALAAMTIPLWCDLVAPGVLDDAAFTARLRAVTERYPAQSAEIAAAVSGGEELLPLFAAAAGVAAGALIGKSSQPSPPPRGGNELTVAPSPWQRDPWWLAVSQPPALTTFPVPSGEELLAQPLPVRPVDELLVESVASALADIGAESTPAGALADIEAFVPLMAAAASGDEFLPAVLFLGGVVVGSAAASGNTSANVSISLSGSGGSKVNAGGVRAV